MNSDGSNPTQLTFDTERSPDFPSYAHVDDSYAKWSPDGTKIGLLSDRNSYPDPLPDSFTIYVMDYQANTVQRLIINQLYCSTCTEICSEMDRFDWSPDGTKFVFGYGKLIIGDGYCEGPFSTNIYRVNTDGSGFARLTNDTNVLNSSPTWSPDGGQMAFASWDQIQAHEIDVMNADGSNRHEIARFDYGHEIGGTTWSPDGSKILFYRYIDGTCPSACGQLYTINPDGTGLRQLTSYPADHRYPRWSPDGKKIAFVRNLSSTSISYAIFVMNADGSDEPMYLTLREEALAISTSTGSRLRRPRAIHPRVF
jgi:Tol biopolymer transport system component